MRKKIVFLAENFYGQLAGGSEYQHYLIASFLKKRNYDVTMMFADYGAPVHLENSFKLARIKKNSFFARVFYPSFFLDAFRVYGTLKRIKPDIIWSRAGFAYVGIAALFAKKNNCKMIWHIASESDVKPLPIKWKRTMLFEYIDKKFLEFGIKKADFILGNAEFQDALLKMRYDRSCDLIVWNFHSLPRRQIRKKNPVEIAWISNFKKLKQPELFINLAREFQDDIGVRFIMIGRPGSQRNWQQNLDAEIQKLKNLEYLGEKSMDEVDKILYGVHILVNTSQYEGFPNSFIQAWMRKVPVVSLAVDPDGLLERKRIGFFSGSFEKMVRNIRSLIDDEKLREEMGENAQKYAFQTHELNTNLRKIEKWLKAISV